MLNKHNTPPMTELAAQVTDATVMGGNAAMLLLAEMKALGEMLPGVAGRADLSVDAVAARARDAEVEASFDNMPV